MRHGGSRGADPFTALAAVVVADAIVDAATAQPPPPPPVVWIDGHYVAVGDRWVWQPGGWQTVRR